MHRAGYSSADSESLQTDVMRFMAIIAFCLIAILALVRNVEPSAEIEPSATNEPSATLEPSAPATAELAAPAPTVANAVPEVVAAPPLKALEPIRPLPEDKPLSGTQKKTKRITAAPPDIAAAPPASYKEPPASYKEPPASYKEPPASYEEPSASYKEPSASYEEEKGLSLRFASDQDFMRLVAKGDIQVYAFKAEDVLSLDRTFHFLEAPAPDRVYELLPQTIPASMAGALHSERTDTGGYVWGIRMPQRLERRIRAFIDKGATGQLIINRYGEVQHAAGA